MSLLEKTLIAALEDRKAVDLARVDVRPWSDQFHVFLIATATSGRHAMAIADYLSETLKHHEAFGKPVRIQKDAEAEWILMDFDTIIVHIMQQEARHFYNLEKLWMTPSAGPRSTSL
ncbi:MAG: ribosome silencing factor [Gammaproteobacteria bacterium]|nr:ribosome silencing factor [Gammaproteobacteria bacterium]